MSRQESIARGSMTPRERELRSALNRLLSGQGLTHGTLISRRRVCGKPSCRCAKGQLHEGLYLVVTEGGKPRQMYVPQSWAAAVRQWIENYQQARQLMDELSALHWDKIRKRQE
jgi:hypothetical protein